MALKIRYGITDKMRNSKWYDKSMCPRCNQYEIGFAATSRTDNKTAICSRCGEAEAMEQFFHDGLLIPQNSWPVYAEFPDVEEFLNATEEAAKRFAEMEKPE